METLTEMSTLSTMSSHNQPALQYTAELSPCCVQTIEKEIALNSMMMCADCRRMIKGFLSERSFSHFVAFCKSRKRQISCHKLENRFIVTYASIV